MPVSTRDSYIAELLANKRSRQENNLALINPAETDINNEFTMQQVASLKADTDLAIKNTNNLQGTLKYEEPTGWERFVSTVEYLGNRAVDAFLSPFDALWDFGVNIAQEISGNDYRYLTDYDWQAQVNQFLNMSSDIVDGSMFKDGYWDLENWSAEQARNNINKNAVNSYIDADSFIGKGLYGIIDGVAQMLPAIALAYFTGGGSAVVLATMGVTSFASGTNEAYEKSGNMGTALLQGLANAGVEVGTEILVGKALKGVGLGTNKIAGYFDLASSSGSTDGAVKTVLKSMFEEGTEEAVASVLQPFVKSISEGENAFYDEDGNFVYGDLGFWATDDDSVLNSFIIGGLVSGVLGGGNIVKQYNTFGKLGMNEIVKPSIELSEEYRKLKRATPYTDNYNKIVNHINQLQEQIRTGYNSLLASGNQTYIDNINQFLDNPIGLVNSIIENDAITVNETLSRDFVSGFNQLAKTELGIVFDDANGQNAYYYAPDNTIHINENLEEYTLPILTHELVGHVILNSVEDSGIMNDIYNEVINSNVLTIDELNNIENKYPELDESGFKEEVVSFAIQKTLQNESYNSIMRRLFPQNFFEKIRNNFLETMLPKQNNNRLVRMVRNGINDFLKGKRINTSETNIATRFSKDISSDTAKVFYNDREIDINLKEVNIDKNGKIIRDKNTEVLFEIAEDELNKAHEVFENVKKNFYDDIVKKYGLSLDIGFDNPSVKSLSSFADRLYRNLDDAKVKNGQLQKPKDYIRGTFIFDSSNYKNLSGVYKDLSNYLTRDIDIKGYENGQEVSGYKGIHLNLNYNDVNIEIQLHTEASWKQKLKSDKFYDKYRSINPKSLKGKALEEYLEGKAQDELEWNYLLESDKDFQYLRAEAKSLKSTASSLGSNSLIDNFAGSTNLEPSNSSNPFGYEHLINRPVEVTVNNSIDDSSSSNNILTSNENFDNANDLTSSEIEELTNKFEEVKFVPNSRELLTIENNKIKNKISELFSGVYDVDNNLDLKFSKNKFVRSKIRHGLTLETIIKALNRIDEGYIIFHQDKNLYEVIVPVVSDKTNKDISIDIEFNLNNINDNNKINLIKNIWSRDNLDNYIAKHESEIIKKRNSPGSGNSFDNYNLEENTENVNTKRGEITISLINQNDFINNISSIYENDYIQGTVNLIVDNLNGEIKDFFGFSDSSIFKYKNSKIISNIKQHKFSIDNLYKAIYDSFTDPSYIFYSKKNDSFTFVSNENNLAISYDIKDLSIKTVFKNERPYNYFENISKGLNDDKSMIYNKNEKERWASIATLPSQVNSIIEKNKSIVKNLKEVKKYSKSGILTNLSAQETKDIANKKQGNVVNKNTIKNSIKNVLNILSKDLEIDIKLSSKIVNDLFTNINLRDNINTSETINEIFNKNVKVGDERIKLSNALTEIFDFSEEQVNDYKNILNQSLERDVLNGLKTSEESKLISKLENIAQNLSEKVAEHKQILNNYKKLQSVINHIKNDIDLNTKEPSFGDIPVNEVSTFKGFVSGRFDLTRGNISGQIRKKAFGLVETGYLDRLKNSVFNEINEDLIDDASWKNGSLGDAISFIEDLAKTYDEKLNRQKPLTLDESEGLINALSDIYKIMQDYRNGIYKEVETKARDIKEVSQYRIKNATSKSFIAKSREFINKLINPMDVFSTMFGGKTSKLYQETVNKLKLAYDAQSLDYTNLMKDFDKIISEKNILYKNGNNNVNFHNIKMRGYDLYSLYLNLSTAENRSKIERAGEIDVFNRKNGKTTKLKYEPDMLEEVESRLSTSEIESLNKIKEFYNTTLKEYMKEAQTKINGFANVIENEYYPIISSSTQKYVNGVNADGTPPFMIDASYWGNLKTRTNAQNRILLTNPILTLQTYIDSLTKYSQMTQAQKEVNRILNKKVDGGDSLMTLLRQNYKEFGSMWKSFNLKLLGRQLSNVNYSKSILDKLGSNYAVAVLSLNLSTPLKQIASLPTASVYTGFLNSLKSLKNSETWDFAKSYKYLMEHNGTFARRMYENGAIRADTLGGTFKTSKKFVKKMVDLGMKPMQAVDTAMVLMSFGQAQQQVETELGYQIGTEANLKEANRRTTDIILFTQSNADSLATSMLRSGEMGDFKKWLFGRFASDSQNKLSLIYESIANYHSNRQYLNKLKGLTNKNANIDAEIKNVEKSINDYKTQIARAIGSLIPSAIISFAAGEIIKMLLGKKDSEEETLEYIATNLLSEMFIDWVPFISTINNYITYGDMSAMPLEAIKDIADSIMPIFEGDISKVKVMNLIEGVSSTLGIPTGNAVDIIIGIVNMFSPEKAIELRSWLYQYSDSYLQSQYTSAKNEGHYNVAMKNLNVLLEVKKGQFNTNQAVKTEIYRLGVLPKDATSDEGNFDNSIYSKASNDFNSIIQNQLYRTMNDEIKEKVVRRIYNSYYDASLDEPTSRFGLLIKGGYDNFAELALEYQILTDLKSDENSTRKDKVLSRLNRFRISTNEKLLLMFLMGYSLNGSEELRLKSYLRRYISNTKDLNAFLGIS